MGPNINLVNTMKPVHIQKLNLNLFKVPLAYTAMAGQFQYSEPTLVMIKQKLIYFPWGHKLRGHIKSFPYILPFKTM